MWDVLMLIRGFITFIFIWFNFISFHVLCSILSVIYCNNFGNHCQKMIQVLGKNVMYLFCTHDNVLMSN